MVPPLPTQHHSPPSAPSVSARIHQHVYFVSWCPFNCALSQSPPLSFITSPWCYFSPGFAFPSSLPFLSLSLLWLALEFSFFLYFLLFLIFNLGPSCNHGEEIACGLFFLSLLKSHCQYCWGTRVSPPVGPPFSFFHFNVRIFPQDCEQKNSFIFIFALFAPSNFSMTL